RDRTLSVLWLAYIRALRRIREALQLRCDEEVQAVTADRAAKAKTLLNLLVGCRRRGPAAARKMVVPAEREHRAAKRVGTGPGDGVDERAGEVAIPHVFRREQNLILLHCFERDGLVAAKGGRDAAQRPFRHAVDQEVVEAESHASRGESGIRQADLRRDLRNEANEVVQIAVQRGKVLEPRLGDRRAGPAVRAGIPRTGRLYYRHGVEPRRQVLQHEVHLT